MNYQYLENVSILYGVTQSLSHILPPEYEAGVLTTRPRCLVQFLWGQSHF
jgi:hypothetical protein